MKFEKIVGFGDSWMWGDEIIDPALVGRPDAHPSLTENKSYRESHAFLGLLADRYSVPWINFGIPGGSQQSSIWNLLWWLDHEDHPDQCLVIVGHTDSNRCSFYNPQHANRLHDSIWNRHIHSSWVHAGCDAVPKEWQDMIKRHMILTGCDALSALTYHQTVMTFDGISARLGFPLLQFDVSQPPRDVDVPSKIWKKKFLSDWLYSHDDYATMHFPGGHPNQKGHILIADMLKSEIDRVILNK